MYRKEMIHIAAADHVWTLINRNMPTHEDKVGSPEKISPQFVSLFQEVSCCSHGAQRRQLTCVRCTHCRGEQEEWKKHSFHGKREAKPCPPNYRIGSSRCRQHMSGSFGVYSARKHNTQISL